MERGGGSGGRDNLERLKEVGGFFLFRDQPLLQASFTVRSLVHRNVLGDCEPVLAVCALEARLVICNIVHSKLLNSVHCLFAHHTFANSRHN